MPTSHYREIPHIIEALIGVNPASILDIGIGCGKWGVLAHEYLEVWDHYFEPWGSRHVRIDGIEIHEQYLSPISRAAYDEIFIGDASEVLPGLGQYDAILMIDVLEHFAHDVGDALLHECAKHARTLIIGVPYRFAPTVEVWGNAHEIHREGGDRYQWHDYGLPNFSVFRGDYCLAVIQTGMQP